MKLTNEVAGRLGCVAAEHLVVACDALLVRLRRIAQVVSAPPTQPRPSLSEAAAAHTAAAEALLNLLSVLHADGTQGAAVERLERGLGKVLAHAGQWFPRDS